MFLSKVEKHLFDICKKQQTHSNFNSEDWNKKNRQGIFRGSLGPKAEKQLSDKYVYNEVNFNKKLIQDLTETSN